MSGGIQVGDVVSYRPERENRWCREGTALAQMSGRSGLFLVDTYWNSLGQESHILTPAEAATAERLFNLADYDEVQQAGTWERYAPDDRQVYTAQHGLQRRLFVRKGATESLATQVENAQGRLAEAEEEAARALRRVDWMRQELAAAREKLAEAAS